MRYRPFIPLIYFVLATFFVASLSAGELKGRVLDAVTGQPAAGVIVSIQATKQSLCDRTREDGAVHETRTDALGEYRFSELLPLAYNVAADADGRTCAALNSISVAQGQVRTVVDLQLVAGSWIEGRVLKLDREPLSRDPATGERLQIALNGPARPNTGASFESTTVDDDGRFRLRVAAGRAFLRILSPTVWQRTWRKEKYERGIEVVAGENLTVNFRILEPKPQHTLPPPRPERDRVKLLPPVPEEWDCAETIRDLGGWYQLDSERHVVAINMVYNNDTGTRFDNGYTDSDEALRIAPAFPRLKKLFLKKGQATDESLACLAELKGLTEFFIWDAITITDDGAKHLANLENLQYIHMGNSQIGDAALKAISKLPKLTQISMQSNDFTDDGLAHLADMKQLRSLWIGMSKRAITDAGLAHLARLENLEQLDLQQSKVTDAGLEHLKDLTKLRTLYLSSSPVTQDGLTQLRKALPNLNVQK